MILKTNIESAFKAQVENLQSREHLVGRRFLNSYKPTGNFVEVISGVRRCGKSTLLNQLMLQAKKPIAYFNFEDSRIFGFDVEDFDKLDDVMGNKVKTYFFDEIQNVHRWELFVRKLNDRGNKVYIIGSNASLLSKELGTRLTGRHIRHELFPFSYTEFLDYVKAKPSDGSLEQFISLGGFPEYLNSLNKEVLQTLLRDITLRDIAIRYGIKNSKSLMDVTLFLLSNVGKIFSYNSIQKTFSIGSANTVLNYLAWLEDAYIFFYLQRFSWSAKSSAINPRKVYAIDTGLVNANSLKFTKDSGRLLENMVFLSLHQQHEKVFYWREKSECDFVVFEANVCQQAIQVCDELHNDNKQRELKGLMEAMEFFELKEGLIITRKQNDVLKMNGYKINLVAASDWLLSLNRKRKK